MPRTPYEITFSDEARALAEAVASMEAVEAQARRDIANWVFQGDDDMDLPSMGFCSVEMPDGTRFVALFGLHRAEIYPVERDESVGRIEEKNPELAEALGLSGEVVFPVAAKQKRT